jgi:hypothetical protein
MRRAVLILALGLLALPAAAQEQQAQEQQALQPPQASGAATAPIFDMVAADRETAWRINRATGEVMVCRIDTTTSLDAVRASCAPVAMEGGGPQQSMTPPPSPSRSAPASGEVSRP